MGPLGWQETIFIFLLALLIFGPKKLPELGRNIGKALTEFRRASSELRATFDREMANIERETAPIKEEAHKIGSDLHNTVYDSSYPHDDYGYSYDGYSYPDYTPDSSIENTEHAENTTTSAEESSSSGAESIQIAQAEGTVAVGSHDDSPVVSTAESATEKADQHEAKA
jgi:TatA/E family protein of Tat protein translocase